MWNSNFIGAILIEILQISSFSYALPKQKTHTDFLIISPLNTVYYLSILLTMYNEHTVINSLYGTAVL